MNAVEILKKSSIFSTLAPNILWRIASLGQERNIDTGEFIIREGEPGPFCCFLITGSVEVFCHDSNGKKLFLARLGPEDILGELAVLDEQPRSASAVALEPTQTLVISAWDFKAQLQAYPEIALQLLPVLAKRLRQTQTILRDLSLL